MAFDALDANPKIETLAPANNDGGREIHIVGLRPLR
jgi:hypothetical protein